MAKKIKIRYPFPKKYVDTYVKKLFGAIKRGECATFVWVATAGRRIMNRFIVDNFDLFKKELPHGKNYLLIYVELLDLTEESQSGYLRLIGKTFIETCQKRKDLNLKFTEKEVRIFKDERAAYAELLEALKNLISRLINLGAEVVIFLGEIDELKFINTIFCNNLRSIWNFFDSKLHYVFLLKDVRLIFAKDYFGEELGYLFFQNVFYAPLSKENENYLVDYFEGKTGYQLTQEKRKIVSQMCDGHPYFLKLAIEVLAKGDVPRAPLSPEKVAGILQANYEIRAVSRRIIESQTDDAQKTLGEIATKKIYKLPEEEAKTLISLGLVRKTKKGYYQPFCRLLQDAILKRTMPSVPSVGLPKKLAFDSELNSIVFQGKPIEEKFTRQEYELLAFFLKEPNKLHSRDKIADTIWGKESYEKYSDWAIDQLISKLRKKLKRLGVVDKALVTLRGRGYKFFG
jgi:hypothetical protein